MKKTGSSNTVSSKKQGQTPSEILRINEELQDHFKIYTPPKGTKVAISDDAIPRRYQR